MFKQLATLALWALGFVSSQAVAVEKIAADTVNLHTLSLQVSVGGKEVMAPVLQMSSAASAQVSIGSGELGGYTLVIDILEPTGSATSDEVAAQFVLWRGAAELGVRLLDDVLMLGGNRQRQASERTLRSRGAEAAVVSVISHATQHQSGEDVAVRTACADREKVIAEGGWSEMAEAKSNCCSSKCQDGSGASLKCCNVISGCCGCGTCCSIP